MNTANVTAGKPKIGGAVFRAPLGTALPTGAVSALAAAYKNLGYISEDAVTNGNSPSSDKARAWGGDVVLNYSEERPDTFKFKMIEALNLEVLKTVYGDKNVTGESMDAGVSVAVGNEDYENYVWVFDMLLKGNIAKRIVVPSAKITELEDIVYKDNEPVGYGVTISAEPVSTGKYHYEYFKKTSGTAETGDVS